MRLRKLNLVLLLIGLICYSQTLFAQKKFVSEKELNELKTNSDKLLSKQSYRHKTTEEKYTQNGTKIIERKVEIFETIPPDRTYRSFSSEVGEEIYKNEFIRIEYRQYVRRNNGKWELHFPQSGFGCPGCVKSKITLPLTFFLEIEKLGDKNTKVYEATDVISFIDGREISRNTKYWFDEDGYLLKVYYKGEHQEKDLIETRETIYDLDSEIKIEEPKVEESSQ